MSLLLDALQRASKDKEKAAAQEAATLVPPVLHVEPPFVPLTLAEAAPTQDAFPPLEQQHEEPLALQTAEPKKSSNWDLPTELTLDLPAPEPERAPALAPTQTPTPTSPAPVPVPVPVQALQSTPALASTEPVAAEPRPSASPPGAGRVAQDMRRAYMPASAPDAKRRRTLVYVGVAIAVVVVLAGLGFKMWEDTASLRGASSLLPPSTAPQMPPPAASVQPDTPANLAGPVPVDIEPLPSAKAKAQPLPSSTQAQAMNVLKQTPVEASTLVAKAAPAVASAPVLAPAPALMAVAAPAQPPASNQVQVHGAGAKQPFESKIRGPSPLELGYAALVAGRWDDAAQYYNQALKANSEERDALLGLAYVAQQKGQRDDAQLLYRRVLRQEPGNAMASAALMALDFEADSSQSASRARELAVRQPDSAATMSMAGTAAVREGLLADAAQLFARAQFLEPANPLHAYNHAVALDRLGQHASAAAQYEQVLKLSEKPTAGKSAFSVAAVQERLAQLRQALGSRSNPPK